MADEEQVQRLQQGVVVCNAWRTAERLTFVDLSGVDLIRANLSSADLRGADLGGADLRRADLREADLREADLSLGPPRHARRESVDFITA
jgi:uncharacterized protein YjbI with pentapeptide repeats